MKILLILFVLLFSSSVVALQFDNSVKVEIKKLSQICEIWKGEEDFILEKKFNINDEFEIITYVCGEADEHFGRFSSTGPSPNAFIGTKGVEILEECKNSFSNWNDGPREKSMTINNLITNQVLIICGWKYADGYFEINQDLTNDKRFLEIHFRGSHQEYHIYMLDNFNIDPIILIYSKSGYNLKTKNGEVKLEYKKDFNFSSILEDHFNIELSNKDIILKPGI